MTASEFKAIFPEFSAYSDARITLMIEQSEFVIAKKTYGDSYDNAIAFHTAHLLTMLDPSVAGGTGVVVSEKVGKLTTVYADPTKLGGADSTYLATQYGVAFLELRKANVITALPLI